MLFNTLLAAAICATSACAAPLTPAAANSIDKRQDDFAHGWCTFHLHEDAAPVLGTESSKVDGDHKLTMTFYDANGDEFDHMSQRKMDHHWTWAFQHLKGELVGTQVKGETDANRLPGWNFEFHGWDPVKGSEWGTEPGTQCSAGKAAV